jgi:coenzyme PQQ precursor peptide PqqA
LTKKNRFALIAAHRHVDDGDNENGRMMMQWNTPKIVEIACGCEINAYFPADL